MVGRVGDAMEVWHKLPFYLFFKSEQNKLLNCDLHTDVTAIIRQPPRVSDCNTCHN